MFEAVALARVRPKHPGGNEVLDENAMAVTWEMKKYLKPFLFRNNPMCHNPMYSRRTSNMRLYEQVIQNQRSRVRFPPWSGRLGRLRMST